MEAGARWECAAHMWSWAGLLQTTMAEPSSGPDLHHTVLECCFAGWWSVYGIVMWSRRFELMEQEVVSAFVWSWPY